MLCMASSSLGEASGQHFFKVVAVGNNLGGRAQFAVQLRQPREVKIVHSREGDGVSCFVVVHGVWHFAAGGCYGLCYLSCACLMKGANALSISSLLPNFPFTRHTNSAVARKESRSSRLRKMS